jgi:DNA-binding response OmpR family regulator
MSTTTSTILVADEHEATRAFLADQLTCDGYQVLVAPDRAKALALLSISHPDLILVDVNGRTLELLDAIRSGEGLGGRADPDTPLIVLSRDADRLQRIRVLDRGGDDVVRKPFAYPELRARIAAVLRRSEMRRSARIVRAGPIAIDVRSREVRVADRLVELSAKEYDLLVTLASEPTRVFTRVNLGSATYSQPGEREARAGLGSRGRASVATLTRMPGCNVITLGQRAAEKFVSDDLRFEAFPAWDARVMGRR